MIVMATTMSPVGRDRALLSVRVANADYRLEAVARLLTGPAANARDGVEWPAAIVRELGIPGLGAYGLTAVDVPAVVAQASQSSSMKDNPIALTTDELERILFGAI